MNILTISCNSFCICFDLSSSFFAIATNSAFRLFNSRTLLSDADDELSSDE